MKKTLFGVLALVLVLATILTGSVSAIVSEGVTAEAAKVKKVAKDVMVIDGEMDVAYKDATPLYIEYRPGEVPGLYTFGIVRFVWCAEEKALYLFAIINDADVSQDGEYPWTSDSLEVFYDWNNNGTQSWGIEGLTGDGVLKRSLQYRVSGGALATPTCYLLEEPAAGGSGAGTYRWDTANSKWTRPDTNAPLLINDTTNVFGWGMNGEVDWGAKRVTLEGSTVGYTVEFRVHNDKVVAGSQIGFDFQLNDRYDVKADGTGKQQNAYYCSTYRNKMSTTADSCTYYDYLTLVDDAVAENKEGSVPMQQMGNFGAADAATKRVVSTEATTKIATAKYTLDPNRNTKTTTGNGNTSNTPVSSNDPQGGSTTKNGGNTTDPTKPGEGETEQGGGCGSSIAVGSSVAMLALVGAAGFFSFRRKDEE